MTTLRDKIIALISSSCCRPPIAALHEPSRETDRELIGQYLDYLKRRNEAETAAFRDLTGEGTIAIDIERVEAILTGLVKTRTVTLIHPVNGHRASLEIPANAEPHVINYARKIFVRSDISPNNYYERDALTLP